MEEEDKYQDEIVQEVAMQEAQSTNHDHKYIEGPINENGLKDVYCACGHGFQIDKNIKVEEGKIKW